MRTKLHGVHRVPSFPRASSTQLSSGNEASATSVQLCDEKREHTERVGGLRALRASLSAVALWLTVDGIRQIEILPAEEAEEYLVYARLSVQIRLGVNLPRWFQLPNRGP